MDTIGRVANVRKRNRDTRELIHLLQPNLCPVTAAGDSTTQVGQIAGTWITANSQEVRLGVSRCARQSDTHTGVAGRRGVEITAQCRQLGENIRRGRERGQPPRCVVL